jgi:hypothetical protein
MNTPDILPADPNTPPPEGYIRLEGIEHQLPGDRHVAVYAVPDGGFHFRWSSKGKTTAVTLTREATQATVDSLAQLWDAVAKAGGVRQ